MGKALLIGIAAFIVLGSYYAVGSRGSLFENERSIALQQFELLARNAAVTGFNEAKQALSGQTDFSDFNGSGTSYSGSYEGASYATTVQASGAIATIRSVGTATDGYGQEVSFTIRAEVELQNGGGASEEVPPFMSYAVLSDEALRLGGEMAGQVVPSGDSHELNASFHTNGNLTVKGGDVRVRGFGTYAGTATFSTGEGEANTFQPNYNPDGNPAHYPSPAVELPDFDAAESAALAAVDETSSGDVTLSGAVAPGGTRENPYIWHVRGNLSASGNTVVSGYVLFLVEGNINVSGSFTADPGGYAGGDESNVALYANGNVSMSGGSTAYGQIYAQGNVTMGGESAVYGSVVAAGEVVMSGSPRVHYRPASPALTSIWGGDANLVLISYVEQ